MLELQGNNYLLFAERTSGDRCTKPELFVDKLELPKSARRPPLHDRLRERATRMLHGSCTLGH